MTCESSIMSRQGIALAADSAMALVAREMLPRVRAALDTRRP
jgi:hypothetical protein